MEHSNLSADELLEQARSSAKQGDDTTSRDYLRQYLMRQHALTRLARVSHDTNEALTAAELALCLNPDDEVAQRAIASKRSAAADQRPERHALSAQISFFTGMTLAQARATVWPFEGGNRTIGELLDSKTKTLRDIAWAYTAAFSERVRDACKTILLSHLLDVEPEQPPRPLRVISGSRYSEREERIALTTAALLAGIAGTLWVLVMAATVVGFFVQASVWLRLALFAVLGLVGALGIAMERRTQRALNYQVGRRGEEQIVEQLRAVLGGRWTLLRNFVYPQRKGGDIDLILLGPAGVWVFEVKAYAGLVRNRGDEWERKTKRGWKKLDVHPGQQARANAVGLKRFLDSEGVKLGWVQPVVIWASSEAPDAEQHGTLTVDQPQTPVWQTDHLLPQIEELAQLPEKLTDVQVAQSVEILQQALTAAQKTTKS